MKQKALFFDIDGTIISEKTQIIPDSAIQALETVKNNGHLTFINTGRTYCCLPKQLFQFQWDGFLCGCGTRLLCHDHLLFCTTLSRYLVSRIIGWMKEANVDGILEGTKNVYFPQETSRFTRLEEIRTDFGDLGLGAAQTLEQCPEADKFVLFSDHHSDLDSLFTHLAPFFSIIDRRNGFYEIVPMGYSKATAIDFICKKYHIEKENTYVFGDSTNDLPMFSCGAKHCIAMGNHDTALNPYATFVTKTVEEDGIAHALSHLELI